MTQNPQFESEKQVVENGFWGKLRPLAKQLPFSKELISGYYCAFDKQTGFKTKAILMGALAYFVLPVDAIPDFMPMLGFTDDAAVIALALSRVRSEIKEEHRKAAQLALEVDEKEQ